MSHESRKTYADLTDEQLIELHRLAFSESVDYPDSDFQVLRPLNSVIQVVMDNEHRTHVMYFGSNSGAFWVKGDNSGRISNIFGIVDKCREFGLSY